MDRFLSLTNQNSSVPCISKIIDTIEDDKNVVFYVMGNWLHSTSELNQIYSLVAIKDIVGLSPLSPDKMKNPDELNPINSFKWLFLLNSVASRKIVDDDNELEQAKNQFFFNSLFNFLKNVDFNVKFAPEFTSAVITVAARFIQSYKCDVSTFATDELYQILIKILQTDFHPCAEEIPLSSFPQQNLFTFLSPLSLQHYEQKNLFNKIQQILQVAVIRLLIRIVPLSFPKDSLEKLKIAIHPLCVDGVIVEASLQLLKTLFNGNETAAFKFKDNIIYKNLASRVIQCFENTNGFKLPLNYQTTIELANSINEIQKLATQHPDVWSLFLEESPELEQAFEHILSSSYDPILIEKSVNLMVNGGVVIKDIAYPVHLFITTPSNTLREGLRALLMNKPEETIAEINNNLRQICNHGSNSQAVFDLISDLIPKIKDPSPLITNILASINQEYTALRFHPNSHLYSKLQQYIDVGASYLDDQPCDVCNNPQRIPRQMSLNDNAQGIKYTHNEINVKFKKPLLISNVKLSFDVKIRQKRPKLIKFFVTSAEVYDTNILATDKIKWIPVFEMKFEKNVNKGDVKLPIPIFATCLKINFDQFWQDSDGQPSICPNCRRSEVNPQSGLCPNCHENAFQCKSCRNINYAHPNPFICTECGNSNFISMNWTITAFESFSHTLVNSHSDVQASLAKVDQLMKNAKGIFDNLQEYREKIETILSPTSKISMQEKCKELNQLYNDKCSSSFKQLTTIVQHVSEIRKAVAQFLGYSNTDEEETENMCYNCRKQYIANSLLVLRRIAELGSEYSTLTTDASKVLISFLEVPDFTAQAALALVSFCKVKSSLTDHIVNIFIQSLPKPSSLLVSLLTDVIKIDDKYKKSRFTTISNALIECVKHQYEDSSMVPTAVAPLVKAVFTSPLIISQSKIYEMNSVFNSWPKKSQITTDLVEPLDVLPEDILLELFISSNSEIRKQVYNLLLKSATLSANNYIKVNQLVLKATELIKQNKGFNGNNTRYEQLFNLIFNLLQSQRVQIHCLLSGYVNDFLVEFLHDEIKKVFSKEKNLSIDLLSGFNINLIAKILNVFLSQGPILRYIIIKKPEILETVIRAYFTLKCIIIQKSNYIDTAEKTLRSKMILLSQPYIEIYTPTQKTKEEELRSPFNRSGSAELQQIEEDTPIRWMTDKGQILLATTAAKMIPFSPSLIINAFTNIVFPPKEALNFQIILKKDQKQEDFLPGRISNSPIDSNHIGLLMRDVKNKICTDLDMTHLIEDEHGMELLVNNNIISLDLPLEDVYLNVWKPTNNKKPMLIIFRLQGLNGEATEPMISSFPSAENDSIPNDVLYKYSLQLSKENLFINFFNVLNSLDPFSISNDMKLLTAFATFKENRIAMNDVNGTGYLFDCLTTLIKDPSVTAEMLTPILTLTEMLVKENPDADQSPEKHVLFLIEELKTKIVRENEGLMSQLLSLVPPLASRSYALMEQVLDFFISSLKTENEDNNFNFFINPASIYYLNSFAEFVLALPNNASCNTFRDIIRKHPFINDAVTVLVSKFPPELDIRSKEWEKGATGVTVPAILKFLAGMVLSNQFTQKLFIENDSMIIRLLLKLRNIASSNNIGELSENVLAAASNEGSLCLQQITDIKKEIEEKQRAKFSQERELLLKQQEEQSSQLQDLLASISDQDEITCCICKEGYLDNPTQPLGIYAYVSHNSGQYHHIATHFVWVHNSCHQADIKSQNHRIDEWSTAAVKNCETPCNTIFPIPGPETSSSSYRQAINQCYGKFRKGENLTTILSDIAYHIEVISGPQKCIPRSIGGGSAEYDVKIIPFLVYAAEILMNEGTAQGGPEMRQNFEKKMQEMLTKPSPYILGYALAIMSLEEWNESKLTILQQMLQPAIKDIPKENRFEAAKSILVQFLIADAANSSLKDKSGKEVTLKDGQVQVGSHTGESWIKGILTKVAESTQDLLDEWQDIADQIESEFSAIEDIDTVFQYANISIDAQQWFDQL